MNRVFLAAVAALAVISAPALAQSTPAGYPNKPVRIIVSSAPGGGQDLTVRPIAQKLSEALGASVVADNRGGASGIIAMDLTRQAAPDGYTFMTAGTTMILQGIAQKVPYDIRTTFDPVVQMTSQPYLMVVHPSIPVTTPKELVAYAKAKPGAMNYGTSGSGSLHNLGMEVFQSITGTKLVHVPYKGSGPALIDLLAGQIQLMFTSTTSAASHVKSGRLRPVGVTSRERVAAYPDLPTLSETVARGYELGNKYSVFAPKGTPKAILARINREIAHIVNTGDVKEKFAADGTNPAPARTVEQFRSDYNREYDFWEQYTRKVKVQL